MKFIFFTFDLISAPIIYKLLEEGNEVIVAQVKNEEDLGNGGKEDKDAKKIRLSNYDGIFTKYDAKEVLKKMKNIKNKDEVFVFFDFNNLWRFSEVVTKMGFTRGFFPTKEDYEFECDRNKAKDIVKKYYKDLSVAEVFEFKKFEDAKEMIEESEDIFVLKGNNEYVKTFVPNTKNVELAKMQILDVLEEHKQDYEKDGFILEKMIQNPMEITPESIWWDGKLIATSIDIENKPLGSGNIGDQTGCSSCLVVKTNLDDKINKISFPPFVEEMAKKHKGLFVWDASLLCSDGKYYFGEFCSCRVGWDSIFNEIMMSGSATKFFQKISDGKNPFIYNFGVSVRGFNIPEKEENSYKLCVSSMNWMESVDKNIFPYEMKNENDKTSNIGSSIDLVVFASASNDLYNAVEETYEAIDNFSFEDLYYRHKNDFLSLDYNNSIQNRYNYGIMCSLYGIEIEEEVKEVETLEVNNLDNIEKI